MLRLIVLYKISLILASNLPWLLAACTRVTGGRPATRSPRGLQYNRRLPICYENLKSALINRPCRLIGRPLI